MDAVVQTKSVENSASLGSIFRLSESGDLIRLDHDQVSEYDFISTDKKLKSQLGWFYGFQVFSRE